MKKSQPLLELIPMILLRVLSKWHQWVPLIQFSASLVSNSTVPCALSFSLGKKKSHWAKLCPLPLPSLFRGYFLSCHSSQETILMLQANIQMYIFFWIAHSDSCSDPGSWPCSESPLSHCCFGYLLMFNLLIFCHSPTLCYYLPFNLVMAGYVFGKGFPASFLKQLGCLQALEQK